MGFSLFAIIALNVACCIIFTYIVHAFMSHSYHSFLHSFMFCGIKSSSLADYRNQLLHFVRINKFVDDESFEAVPMEPTGDEWTEEDQAIYDSEKDEDGDENNNEP